MSLLHKRKLVALILAAILYILSFSSSSISMYSSGLLLVLIFIYMSGSALNNVGDCIYYLVFISPFLGAALAQVIITNKIVEDTFLNEILLISLGYISTWILIVGFGQIKVVKMATLILAQVSTAFYLVCSYFLDLIPIKNLNNFLSSLPNFELLKTLYGYDARNFIDIAVQTLIYPIIVSALLTYIIAEYRDTKHNNKPLNY